MRGINKMLKKYKEWIDTSHPGTKVTYYTGYLATDRVYDYEKAKLGALFLNAYRKKEITLYQKKISAGNTIVDPVYEYKAEKLL